jgi:plastocyanin
MNTLDSRSIRHGSCYAHRFTTAGTFGYTLTPLPSSLATHHGEPPAQAVIVTGDDYDAATQRQHQVTVSVADGHLVAQPAELRVHAGDLVVWSTDTSAAFGFRIRGRIGGELVDSASMRTESVFTYAFGLAGDYEWVDANGSGLRGQVRVRLPEPAADQEERLTRLERGTLVHVRGDRAEPESVEIMVGQTVVWAVEDSPGVSITVATLLTAGAAKGPASM